MRKNLFINIRGKRKNWGFVIFEDPKYLEEWRADGLDIFEPVNVIPEWWVEMGLPVRVYAFFQDILNFRNPFAK